MAVFVNHIERHMFGNSAFGVVAEEQHFADGHTRYENADVEDHHDHILCDECGKIVEFTNDDLERMQEEIAEKLGFVLSHHRMELYGVCETCRAKKQQEA